MTLMEIARRATARMAVRETTSLSKEEKGEKGEKGEKPSVEGTFSPLSPFSSVPSDAETVSLKGNERWDARISRKLMADADRFFEASGLDGRHPDVQSAVDMVFSAHATRDLETVRFAIAEFYATVRRLVSEKLRNTQVPDGYPEG